MLFLRLNIANPNQTINKYVMLLQLIKKKLLNTCWYISLFNFSSVARLGGVPSLLPCVCATCFPLAGRDL